MVKEVAYSSWLLVAGMGRGGRAGSVRAVIFALLMAGLLYLYLPTLTWLGREWLRGGAFPQARDWSHGLLLVLLLAYVLWRRRGELSPTGGSIALGSPLILLGAGLHIASVSIREPYLSAYSLIPLTGGLASLFLGARAGLRLLPLLLLFLLAVPFPATRWGIVGFLQQTIATGGTFLAGLMGAPVQQSGLTITVGQAEYLVEPLCSGFNLLMALLSLVLPLLFLWRASVKTIAASLLWVPALGLVSKILLVSITLALTPHLGQEPTLRLYHGWLGVLFFLVSLGVALLIMARIPSKPVPFSARHSTA